MCSDGGSLSAEAETREPRSILSVHQDRKKDARTEGEFGAGVTGRERTQQAKGTNWVCTRRCTKHVDVQIRDTAQRCLNVTDATDVS